MWKSLILIAVMANTFFITPSEACKCPKNEVYDECPALCPPRECGVNSALMLCAPSPKPGDPDCKPGCRCADGYLRNRAGDCIPEDQCKYDCPKNETLDPCYSPCPPRYCGVNIAAVSCLATTECEPGCRCCDGYLRNGEGICVLEKECPTCTKPNEIYDVCPAPCPPRRCDVDERTIRCAAPPKPGDPECKPGCRCADGYVRNPKGICVTRDQCPPKCGEYESYVDCPPLTCRPQECSQVGFPVPCPIKGPKCPAKPACICDSGYVRNGTSKCIPIKNCPSCGGDPNAVSGCGVNCGKRCSDRDKKSPISCIDICYDNACDCRDGFLYDDNIQKCVRPKQCTPVCGKDEVYSDCINGDCQPKTCSELGRPILCPKIEPSRCIKGCLCREGFVRAANGTCIPKEKCPSCGGDPNAVSGCGVNCGRLCSNYNKGPVACPDICNLNGCDCREGFVLDDTTGKCVLPSQCAPRCGPNEVLSNCSNGGCGPWTCSDVGFPTGCVKMDQKYCKVGCVCEEGYVRNDDTCIPITMCPECGGDPNAVSGCGVNCGRLCSNYNKGPVACPDICEINGCDCKEDFVLDDTTGKCVLPSQCAECGGDPNAIAGCGINCGRLCSNYDKGTVCCIDVCLDNACECRKRFVFDEIIKKCVRPKDCTIQCTGAHEVYDSCPPNCPPQTCESIGQKYFCPLQPANNTKDCKGACRCEKGYLRNKIGDCIATEDCLKCTGPHEYFSCGGACDNVCATLYKQNQTNCPIINIKCNPMCYCEEGYARNKKNKCIPINQCPAPTCGKNERFIQCPTGLCAPKTCSDLGYPVPCPEIPEGASCPEPPACLCIENYVRDANGKCIPQKNCPSCGGDPNAVSGCGVNCGRLCSNYKRNDIACPAICNYNACDCRKGFVLDTNTNKCVRPADCTPICGQNEVYDTCANGGCSKRNCSQLGQPDICIDVIKCIGACVCQEGYLRAYNGTCIPTKQCPITTCGKNERFEQCPAALCEPQLCSQLGFPIACPELIDDESCPGPPGCICDSGYVRNDYGDCIPKNQCPSCGGDPNAVSGCGINCGRLCSNYNKGPVPCPKICKFNSCDCKKDFVLDLNTNKCVRPKECTPVCGDNEVYSECINGGCQAKNCSQLGKPIPCIKINPKYCIKGCLCQEGYLRASNGVCVPQDQCDQCNKPNEYYDSCAPSCPPQTCESIGRQYDCPITAQYCRGACRCNKGYYRNKIGECISKKDCLKCTGPYEYFSCGVACDNVCATLSQQNQTNCPIINVKCNPMCYCEKGYARDDKNICIPIDQCPVSCGGDPNAVPGCGVNCGRLCSNYKKKGVICPYYCKLNGCDCKKEYVYDSNVNKCVLPKQCTPVCGVNEVYDSCANGGCQKRYCSQVGQPTLCIDPIQCNGGCVCQEGFLRTKEGTCVPQDQCPLTCTVPDEY